VRYDFQPRSGKLKLLPKTQVASPDLFDAFALTFASEAAMLARSQDKTGGKPITRQLAPTW